MKPTIFVWFCLFVCVFLLVFFDLLLFPDHTSTFKNISTAKLLIKNKTEHTEFSFPQFFKLPTHEYLTWPLSNIIVEWKKPVSDPKNILLHSFSMPKSKQCCFKHTCNHNPLNSYIQKQIYLSNEIVSCQYDIWFSWIFKPRIYVVVWKINHWKKVKQIDFHSDYPFLTIHFFFLKTIMDSKHIKVDKNQQDEKYFFVSHNGTLPSSAWFCRSLYIFCIAYTVKKGFVDAVFK